MTRIERMKQKAILDVAESLGYSFKRLSGQVYEHPEHDSFRIFADTNTFKWFSRDIQGDVIDFVQLMAGVFLKNPCPTLKLETLNRLRWSKRPITFSLLSKGRTIRARTDIPE